MQYGWSEDNLTAVGVLAVANVALSVIMTVMAKQLLVVVVKPQCCG